MASAATQEIERPATTPLSKVTGVVLDRLFAPHGPAAYFRWVGSPGGAGGSAPAVEAPTEVHDRPEAARSTATTTTTKATGTITAATAEVSFVRAGLTAVAEGTLLETAEAAGLAPRNRCRRGICGTCTTPKLSGTVLDSRTGETSDAVGPIRICVSMAQGDVALDL